MEPRCGLRSRECGIEGGADTIIACVIEACARGWAMVVVVVVSSGGSSDGGWGWRGGSTHPLLLLFFLLLCLLALLNRLGGSGGLHGGRGGGAVAVRGGTVLEVGVVCVRSCHEGRGRS